MFTAIIIIPAKFYYKNTIFVTASYTIVTRNVRHVRRYTIIKVKHGKNISMPFYENVIRDPRGLNR